MKTLTIFTPTYNRAYILPKLYASLCKEVCDDFEWIVVDDGSTDNTEELFREWIKENKIEIKYIKKENGGKMRAHNYAAKICESPLFFCIDSDDQITEGSAGEIIRYYKEIESDNHICGLIAKRRHLNRVCNQRFPNQSESTLSGIYDKGYEGETSIVFKTEILRQFPFLEIEGEKFSTEGYAYMQIDQQYVYKLIDEFWTDCMYQPDGYSMNGVDLYFTSPLGWREYYSLSYKLEARTLKRKVRRMAMYIFSSIAAHCNISKIIIDSPAPYMTLLSYPLGLYYFFSYKRQYIKNIKQRL